MNDAKYENAKFPEAILFRIVLFLNALDIEQALKVCYVWYHTCTNEPMWMKLFLKDFGPQGTYFHSFVANTQAIEIPSNTTTTTATSSSSSNYLTATPQLPQQDLKKRSAEFSDFYKQPKCKWRNAYLYRLHMIDLVTKGNLSITKMYTQPDLQILQMKPNYVKDVYENMTYSAVNERSEDEEYKRFEKVPSQSTMKSATEEGIVDEQSRTIFDLTLEEDSNKEVWKDCGFHLFDVRLIDDYICLNCKKYFRHMERTAVRRNSRHLLAYKLTTARDIHIQHTPTNDVISQWTYAVLNKSSEYGQSIVNRSDKIQLSENYAIEAPVLYNKNHSGFSAGQIMNDARHYPSYGSFYTAWSPSTRTGSLEYLEIMFEEEMYVTGIDIFETFMPGAAFKISTLKKKTQEYQTVWLGVPNQQKLPARSRIFSPTLKKTKYKTNVVRIDFDTRPSKLWTEIDCIRLHGYREPPADYIVDADKQVQQLQEETTLTSKKSQKKLELGKEVMNQYNDVVHLVRQGHVEKFPYEHITSTPFDLHHGLLATVLTESMFYHISCSLVVTGASSFLRNRVLLEAKYTRDYIVAVKLLNNMTCMAIVKQFKLPMAYQIHVWDLRTKKLLKTFELKQCSIDFNDEIAVWEVTESVVACIMGKNVCVFDIYNPSVLRWRHLGNFVHPNLVTSVSLNAEFDDLCNLMVTGCSDGNVRVWSLRTKNCLYTLPHDSPISDARLIAGGAMVATTCIGDTCVRFWTLKHRVAECIKVVTAPVNIHSHTAKALAFDGATFAVFMKGTNEFSLCKFVDPRINGIDNKQITFNKYSLLSLEERNDESCSIL
jgi:hypothetical protein